MKKVPIRLTRKLAEQLDGVDLSKTVVGQTVRLPTPEARLVVLEGWGIPIEERLKPRTNAESRLD